MQQQYGQKLLIKLQQLEDIAAKIVSENDSDNVQVNRDSDAKDEVASAPSDESVARSETVEQDTLQSLKAQFDETKQAYKALSVEINAVPKALSKRFNTAKNSVNAKERAQKTKENEQIKHIRKHISVIDNLIAQGKFRVAISKFAKLQETYSALPSSAKKSVEKRFVKTADDVSRLEGWQDYLAAPRKPALVAEAQALANVAPDNIKQRSDAIKYLRKQWLSLTPSSSNSDESSDDALQQQFDTALEKAFEPCRAHYAKLDQQRAAAREQRESIINTVKAMDITMPEAELVKVFDRASKKWHSAGQVEREVYEELKQEWKTVSSPIQAKVTQWQSDNQTQKRSLVAKAQQLSTEEDITDAADKAQQLQKQWKQIGHAGKREESKLWAEFKAANDTVFERLKAQRKVQNNASNELVDSLLTQTEAIDINSDDASFTQSVNVVQAQLNELPKALRNKVERKIDAIENKRETLVKNAQSQARVARAQALVSLLQLSAGEAGIDDEQSLAETLGKRWSSLLGQSTGSTASQHDRQWLTVALEVATGMPSPDSDASIRSSVQLQMMTSKLEQGEAATAPDILADWLSYDSIDKVDNNLLQRVVAVINAHPEIVA